MTRHALWANSPDSMPRDSNSDFVLILTYFSSIFSLTQILEKKVEIKKKSPLESLHPHLETNYTGNERTHG